MLPFTSRYERGALLQSVGKYNDKKFIGRATRHDGFYASILLILLMFGPELIISSSLPPLRVADLLIIYLLLVRIPKSRRLYGGFFFSYRIRLFILFMISLVFITVFSMGANIGVGRFNFYYKDLFIPLVFIRMMLIGAIAATFHFDVHQIRQFVLCVVILALLSVTLGFGQKLKFFGTGPLIRQLYFASENQIHTLDREVSESRAIGTMGNPNVFGQSLVMLASLMLAFSIYSVGWRRILSMLSFLGLSAAVLIATGSRTALLGLIVISTLGIMFSVRRGSRFIALFIITIFSLGFFLPKAFLEDLSISQRIVNFSAGQDLSTIESFNARLSMWSVSLSQAKDSWLFGVGATKTDQQLTDNGYIFTLMRIGIIGLMIYLAMLFSLLITGLRALMVVSAPMPRAILVGLILILCNHFLCELTGEFFWNIRYGALLSAFLGFLCAISNQVRLDSQLIAAAGGRIKQPTTIPYTAH